LLSGTLYLAGALLLGALLWQAVAWVVGSARGVDFPMPLMTIRRLAEFLGGTELIDHSVYRHIGDSLHFDTRSQQNCFIGHHIPR